MPPMPCGEAPLWGERPRSKAQRRARRRLLLAVSRQAALDFSLFGYPYDCGYQCDGGYVCDYDAIAPQSAEEAVLEGLGVDAGGREGAVPEGAAPRGVVPAVPVEGSLPEGDVPADGLLPEGAVPRGDAFRAGDDADLCDAVDGCVRAGSAAARADPPLPPGVRAAAGAGPPEGAELPGDGPRAGAAVVPRASADGCVRVPGPVLGHGVPGLAAPASEATTFATAPLSEVSLGASESGDGPGAWSEGPGEAVSPRTADMADFAYPRELGGLARAALLRYVDIGLPPCPDCGQELEALHLDRATRNWLRMRTDIECWYCGDVCVHAAFCHACGLLRCDACSFHLEVDEEEKLMLEDPDLARDHVDHVLNGQRRDEGAPIVDGRFFVGHEVGIHGLIKRPELNGRRGQAAPALHICNLKLASVVGGGRRRGCCIRRRRIRRARRAGLLRAAGARASGRRPERRSAAICASAGALARRRRGGGGGRRYSGAFDWRPCCSNKN
ncbi:unnamed protein product [Prorocentrum cordatum]|uniref:Uncharacterized protein n=1 Tax=Prorocentrum cordatum TaxID=2364126 RepID=A0ABN9U7G5_9DINO|nr:unnamed protein product [Polarella glacialis]